MLSSSEEEEDDNDVTNASSESESSNPEDDAIWQAARRGRAKFEAREKKVKFKNIRNFKIYATFLSDWPGRPRQT